MFIVYLLYIFTVCGDVTHASGSVYFPRKLVIVGQGKKEEKVEWKIPPLLISLLFLFFNPSGSLFISSSQPSLTKAYILRSIDALLCCRFAPAYHNRPSSSSRTLRKMINFLFLVLCRTFYDSDSHNKHFVVDNVLLLLSCCCWLKFHQKNKKYIIHSSYRERKAGEYHKEIRPRKEHKTSEENLSAPSNTQTPRVRAESTRKNTHSLDSTRREVHSDIWKQIIIKSYFRLRENLFSAVSVELKNSENISRARTKFLLPQTGFWPTWINASTDREELSRPPMSGGNC